MKKAILYFIAALMLASIPAMDLMAKRASHGDWYFREEWGGTQYSAYVAGNGKVHYKILTYATGSTRNFWAYTDENDITQGSRCWTQLQGSADQSVFLIYEADNKGHNRPIGDGGEGRNPNDRGWVRLKVLSDAIIVTNTYDGVPVHVAPDGQWHEFYLKRMSTEDWLTYLEFDYIEPAAYANQTYFVGNTVHYRREGEKPKDQARGSQTRVLAEVEGGNPDPAPQLQNPFLYVVNENGTTGFGKIGVLYFSVQKPYRYWINGTGDPITCDQNADMMYLNSDDVVRSFYISMEVQRSMDTTQAIILKSNTINIPAYHKIHDFAIRGYRYQENSNQTFSNDRYKEISWKIYYPWEQDIIDGDMFEIQRAYHSDFSDAQTISVIPMEYDSTKLDSIGGVEVQTYTYVDSVPEAWWNPVDNNRYQLYYRIRRASSAQWGWTGHDFAASLTHYPQNEFSPFIYNNNLTYSLADDFETSHQVNFSLGLPNKNMNPERSAEKPGFSYYYLDPKQRFILRRILSELQDTVEIVIPTDSVQKALDEVRFNTNDSIYSRGAITIRYTDVASTPCVHYKYEVYIDTTGVTVSRPDKDYPRHRPVNPASSKDQNVYFTEAANINTLSATKLTYSDGVLLTWELTDGDVGYYTIETRPAGTDSAWTLLVDSLYTGWYKDISANPYVSPEWEYRLTMTYACNGNTKSVSDSVVGSRNPYGKVSGYVRYEDGTACPNIEVNAYRTSSPDAPVQTVLTDENGYYMLDSLLYGSGYAYAITPTSQTAQFEYNHTSSGTATITLDLDDCIAENINFINISSVLLSGRVLYENTTIPARDVNFLLNGIMVKNGTTPYKTDASGNFEFRVPKNSAFTVQAVRDGHWFARDGYVFTLNRVTQQEDSLLTLSEGLPGVRIWDQTKVRLIGRLAGGRIQAEKTLGFGLSQNNLGDDLQMVFELEGDNISHIVSIAEDKTIDHIDAVLRHDLRNGGVLDSVGVTVVEYQKKRIIIHPDVTTGEYEVDLFPVKYKITQATANGYATLFSEGKTSETLDLTNAPLHQYTNTEGGKEVDYNETYSITYHSPIAITCTQMRYGMEVGYYGEETIKRKNILNQNINVPIAQKQADGSYTYLFGAPVFNSDTYQFRVTAHEDYYYNNDPTSPQHEEVRLQGGTLKVYNGMYDAVNTDIQTTELNANGQAYITVPINYVSFLKTGESALRVLDLSVEYEGAYVQSQAIRAYVTGDKAKGQEFTASTHGKVVLLDILRDPPGSGSSAFIEAGTTYKYTYNLNLALTLGINVTIGYGTAASYTMGTFAGLGGGAFVGMKTDINTIKTVGLPIQGKYVYKHNAVYTFATSERIETGSDPFSVGSSADVYIGAVQNVYYGLMDAVQPLDSLTYVTLAARSANGTMRSVAEGTDADGQKYYLAIGTEFGAESYIDATFIYTQDYIENTLLEQLKQRRDALLMTGDSATVAAIAQATQKPAYWSKVMPSDDNFAQEGYYVMILPNNNRMYDDEVASYNRQIFDWFRLMIDNETEKINALRGTKGKLIGTWSLGGSTRLNHTESYEYSNAFTSQIFWPGSSGNLPGADALALYKFFGKTVGDKLTNSYNKLVSGTNEDGDPTYASPLDLKGQTPGASWSLNIKPILNFDMVVDPSHGDSHKKNTGFTLKADDSSYGHLDVSVYRVEDKRSGFNDDPDDTMDETDANSNYVYGSYVYYLNGGASRCPWEGPDSTRFYTPKVPLSAGTLKLENPRLDIDVHERSNVPVDQAAVFTIRLSNEGEMGYGSGNFALPFSLRLTEGSNPKGARILIDGAPLLEEGRVIRLARGEVVTKLVQVYAGEGYDFEDLSLSLVSNCIGRTKGQCTFSVHYMPVACPVNISVPHDKWIMNTLSPQDSAGWYLPVVIDGFDVNYRNFDHIEFQYKLATQSDEAWVNLCSYYANDSLYDRASGTKAMISGGRIENIRFYGERDPMEQKYDLRAVAFCRHGNSFITRTSTVLSGIKDTRPPRVFGEPEPANAILGIGDHLRLHFNEAIAGNYLDEDNNFQVIGYTNETGITTGISLHFDETEASYAESKVVRSISDKSFTIDMLVKPTDPNAAATFFNYDTRGARAFAFGKTADNRLVATLGDHSIYSDTLSEPMTAFTRIAVVYDRTRHSVRFYAGTKDVTDPSVAPFPSDIHFEGSAPLCIGKGFQGNMMEVRLWTKALGGDEISETYLKRLTGYERELIAYYPMDEGTGTVLKDKANGANLYIYGSTWEFQEGISLHINANQKAKMDADLLSRSNKQDETLMFWFKTEAATGDIFSAGRMNDTIGTQIGFDNGVLTFKNYENTWNLAGNYADNAWHHFVLTVNRAYNSVAIYMDDEMKQTFAATKLGEVSGTMYLGGNGFEGNIDEFVIFEQSLPKTLMQSFGTISPVGDEMGLIAYLPFSEMKENSNGILEQVFSVNDQRIIKVNGESVKAMTPLIISVNEGRVSDMGDMSQSAPVEDIGQLTKLNFDWSFNNDELLINLNMPDREINKQTIFVTVRDVEDLNGNPMASPVTWTTFVDRNALKWARKEITAKAIYDSHEEPVTRSIRIINYSGKRHQYTIESLPDWMSVDAPSGSLDPTDEITLTLSFNVDLAVGLYTDVLYLKDEDGLSEPLRIEYEVVAIPPYESVDKGKYPLNMSICAQVMLGESVYDTDPNDIVYALYRNECVGMENISFDEIANTSKVFMTVFGNDDMNRQKIRFQLWQASTGKVYDLHTNRNVLFADGFIYGCDDEQPLILVTSGSETQNIVIKQGWNWISLNLDLSNTGGAIAACMTANDSWMNQDEIKNTNLGLFSRYDETTGNFAGTLENLHFSQIYMVRSTAGNTMRIAGEKLPEDSMKITVRGNGQWSAMPCLFDQATSLTEALAGYYDKATTGDIIKAHDCFATFSSNQRWEGNLTALHPGEGYLFRRMAPGTVEIPFYRQSPSASPKRAANNAEGSIREAIYAFSNLQAATNMTIIASVDGLDVSTSQRLEVFVNDELAAVAEPILIDEETYYFLTVQSDKVGSLRFELNGQPLEPFDISTSRGLVISYEADSHHGSLTSPIVLHPADETGVYKIIENNRVIIIRNNEKYDVNSQKLQ